MTVAAVILAASPASALADADGTPGVRRLTDVAWAGGATPIVVCSFDPDGAVTAALANAEVTLVDPVDPAGGPVAQIVNGVRAAASLVADTDAALVWPARMTWVDAETVTTLIHAYGEDRASVTRPTSDGEPGWPILLPVRHLDAFAALGADRMPPDLFADLEASGVPFRDIETGDPGVIHDVSTARADLPPYAGPPEPADGHAHEWGSAAADEPDDAPGHRPGPAHDARRLIRVRRPRRRTVGIALVVLVAVLAGAFAWYVQPQPVLPEATASLASTPEVTFTDAPDGLEWAPAGATPTTGLIVYPGGKVPPEAYGPAAQAIAAEGYLAVITPMPFNLAVFDIDAADRVRAAHPEIDTWVIAGHSLGGSMAAQHVANRPDAYDGLAFWAAYAATDLSALDLAASSIYGTLDAGAAPHVGPRGQGGAPAGRRVHPDRGRQPRADGLVHGAAERPARDDQPRGPAGAGGRGDGRAARRGRGHAPGRHPRRRPAA